MMSRRWSARVMPSRRRQATRRTVVKLMRVAMLLPVIVATGLFFRAKRLGRGRRRPPLLPWFVAVFLGLVVVNSLVPVPDPFVQEAGNTASALVPGCGDRRARHQNALQGSDRHRVETRRADGG